LIRTACPLFGLLTALIITPRHVKKEQRTGVGMPKASALGKIEKEIERLTPEDQLKLVEKLAHQLRKSGIGVRRERDWKGLYGLGRGIWRGEDAQEYVNSVREDRM
jgi:hypothetical protein